jgi:hypothetical protein
MVGVAGPDRRVALPPHASVSRQNIFVICNRTAFGSELINDSADEAFSINFGEKS